MLNAAPAPTIGQPFHVLDDGGLSLDFHSGQWQAWDSQARFTFVLAGTQGGKTTFGPPWLHREIYHAEFGRGAADYLAVTASYDMFKLKMLPALRDYFEGVTEDGRYWAADRVIELRDPDTGKFKARRSDDDMWGRIILRSAEAGSGLEAATAAAAWLDECGMDTFTADTWRAVLRRLSLYQGRVLGTTTLYVLYNWLRTLYDEWRAGRKDVAFVQFSSIINPSFPKDEYERAVRENPGHVVNMQYRGEYDKPPGMIFDCFDSETMVIPPFAIPGDWPSYGGMDYGGTNTACIRLRHNPAADVFYLTHEYLRGGLTAEQHAANLIAWDCAVWQGGAKSEGQWRREFRQAGLPVAEPVISDVWIGINKVYSTIKAGRFFVFDSCEGTLGQLGTYSRPLDKGTGEPILDEIQNKAQYHFLDALRYALSANYTPMEVH